MDDNTLKGILEAEIDNFKKNDLSISSLRNRISRILYTKRKRFIKNRSTPGIRFII
jgi:hypothetical protein